jgi:hypothetical protein
VEPLILGRRPTGMRPTRYAAVAALVAAAALSGCAQASQTTGGQPPASIAAPTALSQPSESGVDTVATAPAPPPTAGLPSPPPATSPAAASPSGPPTASPLPAVSAPPASASPPAVATQSGPPGGDEPGPQGQLYSKHAAELRLAADLAALHLPPGAVRQSTPIPPAVNQTSGYLGEQTAALDTWWTVPGKKADIKAFFAVQHPDGMSYGGAGGDNRGETTLGFEYPQKAKAPHTFLEVGIAQDGDHVDVRVQLQVGYLPTRTAVEMIPASVTSGKAVYQPPTQMMSNNAKPAPRRNATLSPADVQLLTASLNALDAETPIEHSCPPPDGEEAWFTFRYGGHTVVFHAELNGCGGVEVTADGVPQPELGLGETTYDVVHEALHVTKAENPFLSVSQ